MSVEFWPIVSAVRVVRRQACAEANDPKVVQIPPVKIKSLQALVEYTWKLLPGQVGW